MAMNRFFSLRKMLLGLFLSAVFGARMEAQSSNGLAASDPLFQTIKVQDAALFGAYNTCDLKTVGAMITDDLEFYHDVTGLAVGRQSLVDGVKNNICGKVTRELVDGSLEVYPLKGYGAVEIGIHRFHHPGRQEHDVLGEAKFVHVWQYKDGVWRLARVISFNHEAVKPGS
jgi:hypothetical protein